LDPQGKLLKRYDKTPAPAQEGDSIAANLISVGLQQVVASGTAQRLNADGLGRLGDAAGGDCTHGGLGLARADLDHVFVAALGGQRLHRAAGAE
ncbi:hypothetical protein, partial [Mesorhizobium sp. M8A.F.Ca.ET.142.01.1.1]|uniref:hypothetical protein n=1 Tax=Mesorhizobium sp. M8A.F.Ca.ET.142.01.1.1 TaxID=2563958 RepID=UPI00113E44BB